MIRKYKTMSTYALVLEPIFQMDGNRCKQGSHQINLLSDLHLICLNQVERHASREISLDVL